jgi:hypothetical protein
MTGLVSYISSANTATGITPQTIWNDTSAFLMSNDKLKYLKDMGVEMDEDLLNLYLIIDKICPIEIIDSYKVLAVAIEENRSIASLMVEDTAVATTGTGAFMDTIMEMFKMGIGLQFSEKQQIEFDELRSAGRIPPVYVEKITLNVDSLQYRLYALLIVITIKILSTGGVNWTDPRTGLNYQMGYNYLPELFPAPLTGIKRWSQAATATGIKDIVELLKKYYQRNGARPKYIVMHSFTMLMLCEQQSTRDYLISINMMSATPVGNVIITFELLQQIFKAHRLPEILLLDAQVQIEPKPGVYQRVNVLNIGAIFFANAKMGKRFFGKLVENKGKAGIFVDTNPPNLKRYEEKIEAVARCVSYFPDAKLLCGQVVD